MDLMKNTLNNIFIYPTSPNKLANILLGKVG